MKFTSWLDRQIYKRSLKDPVCRLAIEWRSSQHPNHKGRTSRDMRRALVEASTPVDGLLTAVQEWRRQTPLRLR